jgi:putative peptidoglycan lipid II flippase
MSAIESDRSTVDTTDRPDAAAAQEPLWHEGQAGLARSALLLSIGNIASRLLGLVRETVIARTFPLAQVSAFTVASQVPTLLYDFLIGGMLSAALVPVLSDYAGRGRQEFTRLVSLLVTIFFLLLALLTVALYLLAPQVADLLTLFDEQDATLLLTTQLIRQISPAIWLFSMAGLLTAILYALRRFTWPALATALYNLGIVVAAPLLAPQIGIASLVVGILAGAAAQFALMGWDLYRVGLPLRPTWQWRHPALRRILWLYAPIAFGLVVSLFQIGLDRRLASGTAAESIALMRYATTLQQLPLGLISVAIALASLPRLSQVYAAGNQLAYREILGRSLRTVLLLVLPAAVLLWLLGAPIARLLFGRSELTAADLAAVVAALRIYLIGMLFAAVDFPLNYAFYARHNTLLPAAVGVVSVGVYLVVAFALLQPLGYLGLVWADSAKQASHALIMVAMLYWRVGPLEARVGRGILQMVGAALAMALLVMLLLRVVGESWPQHWLFNLLYLAIIGGGSTVFYGVLLHYLGVTEVAQLQRQIRARLPW